jgi:ATP-binding cassette subfamily F protein 3
MAILSLNGISKSFGIQHVLKDISFNIEAGQKIGIIGPNGAGKSTLFKIICGETSPDTGQVTIARDTTISYMPQTAQLDTDNTLFDEMVSVFDDLKHMEFNMRQLEKNISEEASKEGSKLEQYMSEYSRITDEFNRRGGFGYESLARGMIAGLGFDTSDYEKSVNNLSGGQKTRVVLGKMLLKRPDILLLDEPTNYLDLEAVRWLEGFLKDYSGTVLVISHDRYFLDAVTGHTLELYNGKIKGFSGNYSVYMNYKKAQEAQERKIFDLRQRQIERLEQQVERFRSMRNFNQANSRLKVLERIGLPDKPNSRGRESRFGFGINTKSGNDVLIVDGLSKGFGEEYLFEKISFEIKKGERVCLIGYNGAGKTTLFKIIAGLLSPDEGDVITGRNVEIGYYHQELEGLDDNNTALDEVWNAYPELTRTEVRSLLARFGIRGDDVFKNIEDLSGGEKSRVALTKLLLSQANLLLLDEPTNHLDMDMKEALEEALLEYPGTVFAISHDRYFLNKVATRILELTADGIVNYGGNYDYYLYKSEEKKQTVEPPKAKKSRSTVDQQEIIARREAKERKKAIAELEDRITESEFRLGELENDLADPKVYSDPDKARETNLEYQQLKISLEEMYDEWERLASGE